MNVKVYVDKIKKWVQISSDEVLDVNKNLSDLKDKEAAITNLGLYEKFISKEALESGFLPDVFTHQIILLQIQLISLLPMKKKINGIIN